AQRTRGFADEFRRTRDALVFRSGIQRSQEEEADKSASLLLPLSHCSKSSPVFPAGRTGFAGMGSVHACRPAWERPRGLLPRWIGFLGGGFQAALDRVTVAGTNRVAANGLSPEPSSSGRS